MAKAPYIEEGRLRHLSKVAATAGGSPPRNVALLTTMYGTGMMLTEIARMPIRACETYKLIPRPTRSGAISHSRDSLSQLFRKLHLQAGTEGAGAMSGRRSFAVRLADHGYDLQHINELLGHETLTATKRLIDANPARLSAIVARVI